MKRFNAPHYFPLTVLSRINMKLGTLIATNENLTAPEAEDELVAAETATEVAEVNTEVTSEESEIDNIDTALADGEAAEDKITELQDLAEDSLVGDGEEVVEGELGQEGEGLTEGGAAVVEITLESILKPIGMSHVRMQPSLESFKTKQGRREVTMEALENLKESGKKLADNIVAGLKAALNTVVNFIVGLMKHRGLLIKHLTNLVAKAKGLGSGSGKEAKVKGGAKALGGSLQSAMEIIGNSGKLVDACEAAAEVLNSTKENVAPAVSAKLLASGINGLKVSGGRTVEIGADDDSVKIELKEGADVKEADALDRGGMVKLGDAAIDLLKRLQTFEKTQSKLKSAVTAIIARVSEAYSKTRAQIDVSRANVDGMVKHAADYFAKRDARVARTLMSKIGGSFPSAAFAAAKGAADYITASLNNFKGGAGGGSDEGSGGASTSTSTALATV